MNWINTKYILLISGRLQKFKRKSQALYNFRCPFCGDSSKNPNKARGYIYSRKADFWFACHNCNKQLPFTKFLKELDVGLYESYRADLFNDRYSDQDKSILPDEDKFTMLRDNKALLALEPISDLTSRHPARKYIESRLIPNKFFSELYFCERFQSWTNSQIPNKYVDYLYEEERIIIPLFDPSGIMFAYQGRHMEPSAKLRYVSITLDESKPKIWGWNRVDFNRKFFILEGPIDAMFLSNAIATAGGKITYELMKIGCNIDNAVVVYDNEPRNPQIVANIGNAIKNNYSVVIWPKNLSYKDINEMVLANFTNIEALLKKHTFKGLEAELEFAAWKKL
jgi:hypothetical protein